MCPIHTAINNFGGGVLIKIFLDKFKHMFETYV